MTPHHLRSPPVAYHEAGHVVALLALCYAFKSARVFTMRESYTQAVRGDGNRWFTMRGQVDWDDTVSPRLRAADVQPGPELDAMRARVIDMAAVSLAGPVAEARYSKAGLPMLLQEPGVMSDTIMVHDLAAEWFPDQPSDLWCAALPVAQRIICRPEGWQAVQGVARQLVECGTLRTYNEGVI